jgi:hypothetical protein
MFGSDWQCGKGPVSIESIRVVLVVMTCGL